MLRVVTSSREDREAGTLFYLIVVLFIILLIIYGQISWKIRKLCVGRTTAAVEKLSGGLGFCLPSMVGSFAVALDHDLLNNYTAVNGQRSFC